jgi:hypothetical protein
MIVPRKELCSSFWTPGESGSLVVDPLIEVGTTGQNCDRAVGIASKDDLFHLCQLFYCFDDGSRNASIDDYHQFRLFREDRVGHKYLAYVQVVNGHHFHRRSHNSPLPGIVRNDRDNREPERPGKQGEVRGRSHVGENLFQGFRFQNVPGRGVHHPAIGADGLCNFRGGYLDIVAYDPALVIHPEPVLKEESCHSALGRGISKLPYDIGPHVKRVFGLPVLIHHCCIIGISEQEPIGYLGDFPPRMPAKLVCSL